MFVANAQRISLKYEPSSVLCLVRYIVCGYEVLASGKTFRWLFG